MAERMAYFGLSVNMVAFMFYIMHRPFTSSSNAVNNFLGISQVSSVLGGFLADAYLGRYWTIAIFTTIYLAVRCVHEHVVVNQFLKLNPWRFTDDAFSFQSLFPGGLDRYNPVCNNEYFHAGPGSMRSAILAFG